MYMYSQHTHTQNTHTHTHTQFQAVLASPVDKSESPVMLREELRQTQHNLALWQDSYRQAKGACEAWKKEVEDVTGRARLEREEGMRRIEEVSQGGRKRGGRRFL